MLNSVRLRSSPFVVLLLACAARPAAADEIRSGFDTGSEGWSSSAGGALTFSATGGNPGGFLQQADLDLTDMFVIAPAAYLGNRTAFLGGTLSFDARQVVGTSDYAPFGIVIIRSGGTTVFADIAPPGNPTTDWRTFSMTLDAASFGTSPAEFASILGNVTAIEVGLESQVGVVETTGFDNFRIVTPVPEPSSGGLMALIVAAFGSVGVRRSLRRHGHAGRGCRGEPAV